MSNPINNFPFSILKQFNMACYTILTTLIAFTIIINITTTTRADLVNHIYLFDNNEPTDETAHYKSIMVRPQNVNNNQQIEDSLYRSTESSFNGPRINNYGGAGDVDGDSSIPSSNAALDLDQPPQTVASFSGHLNNNRFGGSNYADFNRQQQQPVIDVPQQAFVGSLLGGSPEIETREEIQQQQPQRELSNNQNSPYLNSRENTNSFTANSLNSVDEEKRKLEKLMESPLYMQYHRYKEALRRHQLEKQQRRLSSLHKPQQEVSLPLSGKFS